MAICETAMPCQADFLVALTRVWTHLQNSTPPVKWRWACWRATRPGIAGGRRTFAVGGWLRVAPGCAARKQAGFNMVRGRKRFAIATVYGTKIWLPFGCSVGPRNFAAIRERTYPHFLQKRLQPGTNGRYYSGHFVPRPFVFIDFSGSTFIVNIFWGGVIPAVGCFRVEDSQEGGRVAPELHRTSSL